jgi:surface polysaccharide O-acyltransferase-like enzyme
MDKDKILYLDFLRCIAMFSVIFLHITSKAITLTELYSTSWYVYNFLRCFSKWGVNVFIMISGVLFLNPEKEVSISKIWKKYIFSIFVILFFWSFLYAIYPIVRDILSNGYIDISERMSTFIKSFVLGNYHLWFLYMIIGLYIITPFLRDIVLQNNNITYFLTLSFVFSIAIPTVKTLVNNELVTGFIDKFSINLVCGYVFFYVMGYYLNTKIYNKYSIIFLKILVVFILCITIILTSKHEGSHTITDGVFSLCNTVSSICIFVIVKEHGFGEKTEKIIFWLSNNSLGIYLLHAFFVADFTIFFKNKLITGFDVVIAFLAVLFVSLISTIIIKKIPYIGKKIV